MAAAAAHARITEVVKRGVEFRSWRRGTEDGKRVGMWDGTGAAALGLLVPWWWPARAKAPRCVATTPSVLKCRAFWIFIDKL